MEEKTKMSPEIIQIPLTNQTTETTIMTQKKEPRNREKTNRNERIYGTKSNSEKKGQKFIHTNRNKKTKNNINNTCDRKTPHFGHQIRNTNHRKSPEIDANKKFTLLTSEDWG